MANSLAKNNVNELKAILDGEGMVKRLQDILGKRATGFASSIISAASSNPNLAQCDPMTIVQAAMQAAVLDLPIQQNLGFAYLIPYYNGKTKKYECQFQMGYKGFIQLAIRTGLYNKITVTDIREGELIDWSPLTEEIEVELIKDQKERLKQPIVGYVGYFKMLNGYTKTDYWTIDELMEHANRYSKQFQKYQSGMWKDQRDAMCRKTVIKNLISKWGALSVDMQTPNEQLFTAMQADQAVIRAEGEYEYIDGTTGEIIEVDSEEPEMIEAEIKETETPKEETSKKNKTKEETTKDGEEELITKEQQKALFEAGDEKIVKEAILMCGYESTAEIPQKYFDDVMALIKEKSEEE